MHQHLAFNEDFFDSVISEQFVEKQFFKSIQLAGTLPLSKPGFFRLFSELNFEHGAVSSLSDLSALSEVGALKTLGERKEFLRLRSDVILRLDRSLQSSHVLLRHYQRAA